jgi:lysophospholipase L1-like esterase
MKTLFINIAVFCTLWVVVHLTLITAAQLVDTFGSGKSRLVLPNYENHEWAAQHFAEFGDQDYRYHSFLGWRRLPYHGETINIDERGIRQTVDRTPNGADRKIFFFGGSTTWGTGVSDEYTIPSQFASITREYQATNYGEAAYTAHQSLEMLIKVLQEGERPDIVVFYDGVNDVKYKCRSAHNWYSHSWEDRYVPRFELYDSVFSLDYALGPMSRVAQILKSSVRVGLNIEAETYNCNKDIRKAERIAAALVHDWKIAQTIVKAHGGQFFGFLQPISYFSRTKLEHISVSEELRKQYELIYPMVKELMREERSFHDLTDLFDRNEYIYVDYAHVSPNGNRYAAERILSIIDAHSDGLETDLGPQQ